MKLVKLLILKILVLYFSGLTAQPLANFTASLTSGCSPLNVQFTNTSSGGPTSFLWSFGNGNSSSLQNPSATYVVPGTYEVSLRVTNSLGTDIKIKSAFITVFTSPIASFTVNKTAGCTPLLTQFTNTSSTGSSAITTWLWDFGDGNISNQQNPIHNYLTTGAKNVLLTVTDANGCSGNKLVTASVVVSQPHTVDFSASNNRPCKSPSVSTFTSTVTPGNPNYIYEWSTSTGHSSNLQNPMFNFNVTGAISVTLKVKDPNGCEVSITKPDAVIINDIKADFTTPTSPLCSDYPIKFSNQTVPNSNDVTYKWLLNGNAVSSQKEPFINFDQGVHQLKLVSTRSNCSDSIIKNISVFKSPKAAFSYAPFILCRLPDTLFFTDLSVGSGLTYSWDFGNGQKSTQRNTTGIFTSYVSNHAQLLVTDVNGCTGYADTIIMHTSDHLTIEGINQKEGCAPYTARFNAKPTGTFVSYEWTFRDTIVSTNQSFNLTFPYPGKYPVKLKGITSKGCVIEQYDTVSVGDFLVFDFDADKRVGCYSSINPIKLTLKENSGLSGLTYEWQWRGGGSTLRNPSMTVKDTGWHSVKVTIRYNGCVSTLKKDNYIDVHPAKVKLLRLDSICRDTVRLKGSLSKGKNTFLWDFGDGDTSTLADPLHLYDSVGRFKVKLIVVDTFYDCPDTAEIEVFMPDSPALDFTLSDSIGCAPLKLTMKNKTVLTDLSAAITTVKWEFSPKDTASEDSASCTLTKGGWYYLKMKIDDKEDCKYDLTKDSAVFVSAGTANLVLLPALGCIPLQVIATDSSVTNLPIKERRWVWSPTDSVLTTADSILSDTNIYRDPSKPQKNGFDVRLTIKDSIGCEFSSTQKVLPTYPLPRFTINRSINCGLQTIIAIADTSSNNAILPAVYRWKVAGINYSGRVFSSVFFYQDTTIKLSLTITDSIGCSQTKDTLLRIINKKPKAAFYAEPRSKSCYEPIAPISLFDTSTIGTVPIAFWNWRIGNINSNLKNPTITFNKPGNFDVSLTIMDELGCIDSLSIKDYLYLGGPIGTFNLAPTTGCVPHVTEFISTSPNAKYFIWDLGDGNIDTTLVGNFNYSYLQAGVYYPRLTLVDSNGTCTYGFDTIGAIVVNPLPEPNFIADKEVVCFNTTVNFTNTTSNSTNINNWKWLFNNQDIYNGFGPIQHLYPKAGKYSVMLTATDNNGCVDSITKKDFVTVLDDTIAPDAPNLNRATVLNNTNTWFEFNKYHEIDFYKYRLLYNYRNNAPLSWLDVFAANDTTYNHQYLNTLINTYTYAVITTDVCGNVSDTAIKHTTVNVTAKAQVNGVKINWTPYEGFSSIKKYEIWRNNPALANTFELINSTTPGVINYLDSSVTCYATYYYQIKTISNIDTTIHSWSDTSGAVPIFVSTIPSTENIRVTVVADSYVLLQWQKRVHKIGFTYLIYKMRDDQTVPVFFKETTDTFLVDADVDVDKHSYLYYTYLKDVCGAISTSSNLAKTILLKVDLKENDILIYDPIITFTKYQNWDSGLSKYQSSFYYDSTNSFNKISDNLPTDTVFFHKYVNLVQRDYCYKVTGFKKGNDGVYSESNVACIETKPRLYAPNAFTLNGDGINEKFVLGGVFLDEYHLLIYDRWGKLVFESNSINNSWDGTFEGKPCAADVYVYIAEGKGRKSQQISIKGNVTLLR